MDRRRETHEEYWATKEWATEHVLRAQGAVFVQKPAVLHPDARPIIPPNFFPPKYLTETVEEYETHWHASTVLELAEIAARSGDKS